MKLFDVDTSLKWINVFWDGDEYSIHFRDNVLNGVRDVEVYKNDKKVNAKVESTYPPLKAIVADMWRTRVSPWFKKRLR